MLITKVQIKYGEKIDVNFIIIAQIMNIIEVVVS